MGRKAYTPEQRMKAEKDKASATRSLREIKSFMGRYNFGVEIEGFVNRNKYTNFRMQVEDFVFGSDASVRVTNRQVNTDVELRSMIVKDKETLESFDRGVKVIEKYGKKKVFGVNKSCGLHIHISPKDRGGWTKFEKKMICYTLKKLIRKDAKTLGIKQYRWRNFYCNGSNPSSHYSTASISDHYPTIEVRIFQSTYDRVLILKWIDATLLGVQDILHGDTFEELFIDKQ